jgi:hypothetical protein
LGKLLKDCNQLSVISYQLSVISEQSKIKMNFQLLPENLYLNAQQLKNLKVYLELLLLALESLTGIRAASLEQSENLNLEAARSLVKVICNSAKQHQELLRRAVTLLEQVAAQNKEPQRTALLGSYLQQFSCLYEERTGREAELSSERLYQLAFKLLIDLLFYSEANGDRRLWSALIGF